MPLHRVIWTEHHKDCNQELIPLPAKTQEDRPDPLLSIVLEAFKQDYPRLSLMYPGLVVAKLHHFFPLRQVCACQWAFVLTDPLIMQLGMQPSPYNAQIARAVRSILVKVIDQTFDQTVYPDSHALAIRFVSEGDVNVKQFGKIIRLHP